MQSSWYVLPGGSSLPLFSRHPLFLSLGEQNGVLASELADELFLFSHSSSSLLDNSYKQTVKISLLYNANRAGTFREAMICGSCFYLANCVWPLLSWTMFCPPPWVTRSNNAPRVDMLLPNVTNESKAGSEKGILWDKIPTFLSYFPHSYFFHCPFCRR